MAGRDLREHTKENMKQLKNRLQKKTNDGGSSMPTSRSTHERRNEQQKQVDKTLSPTDRKATRE